MGCITFGITFWIISIYLLCTCDCTEDEEKEKTFDSYPLGLTNGKIKDWQLDASSVILPSEDKNCAIKFARLHEKGKRKFAQIYACHLFKIPDV